MTDCYATFDGIEDISFFEYTFSRDIEPAALIVECAPQDELVSAAGGFVIRYGDNEYTLPDMQPVDQWLQNGSGDADDREAPAPRMFVRMLDHRRRWKNGAITGRYNIRLADGTVLSTSKKEPAELAALCLAAMGEVDYDVGRVPSGVYPPAVWDNSNPSQCLDHLCRYVGCVIPGGQRARVTIWPRNVGNDLSFEDDAINNPPYILRDTNGPTSITVNGGPTIWQAKLKLQGQVIQNGVAGTLHSLQWVWESPFSFPDLTTDETRHDAFESAFRQFAVTSLADGSNNLPLRPFPITAPHQYLLQDFRLDTFEDLAGVPQNMPPRVEGLFFPYSDDAEAYTSPRPYTGRFLLRRAGNIVEFPYPIWGLGIGNTIQAPTLYLLTSFGLQTADRDGVAIFSATSNTGGTLGVKILKRPEIFYAVKISYGADGITTGGASSTRPAASNEAQRYLQIFATAYQSIDQVDVEYGDIRNIELDGKIAQCRYRGSVRPQDGGFTTRASQGFEFDIYSPTPEEARAKRYGISSSEGSSP